jgi:hypothetical protein
MILNALVATNRPKTRSRSSRTAAMVMERSGEGARGVYCTGDPDRCQRRSYPAPPCALRPSDR